jgi:hypothetical protein
MTDDIVARVRKQMAFASRSDRKYERPMNWNDADALLDEIERLRAALVKIMQKCPYARKNQWCAGLDCTCIIIRAALEGEKTDD